MKIPAINVLIPRLKGKNRVFVPCQPIKPQYKSKKEEVK